MLAREVPDHAFVDVRKSPLSPADTLAIVRRHKHAIAKTGSKLREVDPSKASDDELLKMFLGREGSMRAPVVSDGETIVAGFVEESLLAMLAARK